MPATTGVLSEPHEIRRTGPPVPLVMGASGDAGHPGRAAKRPAEERRPVLRGLR